MSTFELISLKKSCVPNNLSASLHFSLLQREGEVLLKNYHVSLQTTFISYQYFIPKNLFARVHTLGDIWLFISVGNLWPTRYFALHNYWLQACGLESNQIIILLVKKNDNWNSKEIVENQCARISFVIPAKDWIICSFNSCC